MKPLQILTCLFLILPPLVGAQTPTQELILTGEWGEILDESPTYDKGFVACGTYQDSLGRNHALLMRFDSTVNLLWAKGYDFSNDDQALSVRQTPDSGFVLGGHAVNGLGSQDMLLIKTKANGDLEWGRRYGGSGTDWGRIALVDPFGGYIMGGSSNSTTSSTDALLIKTDLSGNLLWSSTYGGQMIDGIYKGVVSSEFGYFFAGHSFSSTLSQESFVLSLDPFNNFRWATELPDNSFGRAREIELVDSSLYLLADYTVSGASNPDILLTQIDNSGHPQQSRLLSSPNFEQCRDFTPDGQGGWRITGLYRESGADNRPFQVHVDSMGQVVSAYGYGSSESDIGNAISLVGSTGHTVIGGLSEGFRINTTDPAPYFLVSDTNGLTGCNDLPLNFSSDTLTLPFLQPNLVITANPGISVFQGGPGTQIDLSPSELPVCTLTGSSLSGFSPPPEIWPNPASSQLYSTFQGSHIWRNALGEEIQVPFTQGAITIFQVEALPDGMYFLSFGKEDQLASRRVLIRH